MVLKLQDDLDFIMRVLREALRSKLEAQGHGKRNLSKLIDSMIYEIEDSANILVASMYLEDYYIFVERGVKKSRIPYQPGSGKKSSKYIDGLVRYWRVKRGLSPKEAKRAAFALANKHKKEGMPTRNSFKFSKDGTRLGFVEDTLKAQEERVFKILERRTGDQVELTFTNLLNEIQQKIRT